MSFDARSVLVLGGFLCWILAAAIEFQAVRPSGRRLMPDAWTLALLANGLGLNLISQRGLIADVWSIALAHAMLLAGLLLYYVALQKVRGAEPNRLLLFAMPVSVAIALPVVGFTPEAFPMRVLVVMLAWLFGFSLATWSAFQIARTGYLGGASLILGSNLVLAVLAAAFAVAVGTHEVADVFAGSGVELAFYGITDFCIALSTFGYMDIVRVSRSRLVADDPMQPDSLTGLFSGHAFRKTGAGELQRARRGGYPVCTMAIQIDGLDAIRTSRGLAFANQALKRVAAIILREIRIYDVAGRVHTDLIGVVMPEMGLAQGLDVANRIRTIVAEDPSNANAETRIEISAGVCEAGAAGEDLDRAMAVAANCLDRAQIEGGNRVVSPGSPSSKEFLQDSI